MAFATLLVEGGEALCTEGGAELVTEGSPSRSIPHQVLLTLTPFSSPPPIVFSDQCQVTIIRELGEVVTYCYGGTTLQYRRPFIVDRSTVLTVTWRGGVRARCIRVRFMQQS